MVRIFLFLLPAFCPAWVKFITDQYKDYIRTCLPADLAGMMLSNNSGVLPCPENAKAKRTVMVSVMPCHKKTEGNPSKQLYRRRADTDIVITTTG